MSIERNDEDTPEATDAWHRFLKAGRELFSVIDIYSPEGEDGYVTAVHFAASQEELEGSVRAAFKDLEEASSD